MQIFSIKMDLFLGKKKMQADFENERNKTPKL